MKRLIALTLFMAILSGPTPSQAEQINTRFFANEAVQREHPHSYVLQPEAESFVRAMDKNTIEVRDTLVQAIIQSPVLYQAIKDWEALSFDEQVPFLKQIFELEVKLMKISPPELIFDAKAIPGRAAFFEFDINNPSAGKVILNPDVLSKMDKHASLSLLLHETRHSAQFQLAYKRPNENDEDLIMAHAYRASFETQQSTNVESFCDFLTLANEYEAFQFGNYVLGKLTHWGVDLLDMGTLASQYNAHGKLKIDLLKLLDSHDNRKLIEIFNDLEVEQCKDLGVCPLPIH